MAENPKPGDAPKKPSFSKEDFDELIRLSRTLGVTIEGVGDGFESFVKHTKNASLILKGLRTDTAELFSDITSASRVLRENLESLTNSTKFFQKQAASATRSLASMFDDLTEDKLNISDLDDKELRKMKEKAQRQQLLLRQAIDAKVLKGDELTAALQNLQGAIQLNAKISERIIKEKQYTKQVGLTGIALQGVSKIMGTLGMSDYFNLQDTLKTMKSMAKGGSSPFEIMKFAAKEVGTSLSAALKDPLLQITLLYKYFKFIVTSATDYQKKVFEASKNLGVSVSFSEKLTSNFVKIANENGKLALTSDQLNSTYQKLTESTGVLVDQNSDFLVTATALERRLGISAEEQANIQLFARKTGKDYLGAYQTLVGTAKVQANSLKISMSERQILQAIGKVSATIFNNFNGNQKELAKAVVQATKLGVTLDQINSAGMSLLDFESSISKEFEAQLLTGKNIDLNMARQYALTGQTDLLMKEITAQLGNQAEWNRMNVLQQQSLAEAMGMSKEAVDEMYRKQTLISVLGENANKSEAEQYKLLIEQNKSHEEIAEIMGRESAEQAMRVSVQEQMNAAMTRFSDSIGKATQAFMPIIEIMSNFAAGLTTILNSTGALRVTLIGVGVALSALVVRSIALNFQKTKALNTQRTENLLARQNELSLQKQIVLENTKLSAKKREIALSKIQRQQASISARINAVNAAASTTAGSGYLGPGALAVGSLVLTTLLGYLSSMGDDTGGGAVPSINAGAGSFTAPSLKTDEGNINPMNPATAATQVNTIQVNKSEKPSVLINFIDQSKVDPITGKKLRQVYAESSNADAKSGQFGNALSFR